MSTLLWWGYVHTSGTTQAKRYFGPEDIQEAKESPFCVAVYGPFEAKDRDEALKIIAQQHALGKPKLSLHSITEQEIDALALAFAESESFPTFSADLWKGFIFGFKKAQSILIKEKQS